MTATEIERRSGRSGTPPASPPCLDHEGVERSVAHPRALQQPCCSPHLHSKLPCRTADRRPGRVAELKADELSSSKQGWLD